MFETGLSLVCFLACNVVVVIVNRGSLPGVNKHESASDFFGGYVFIGHKALYQKGPI